MAIGRISGPLLKANLLRDGVDLAFETDLVYLRVEDSNSINHKVGIKNDNPLYTLDVNGTIHGTDILTELLNVDNVKINGNLIVATSGNLQLQTDDLAGRVQIGNAEIPNIYSNVTVHGDLHATGNITADGTITLGNEDTDNVVFGAEINSDIIPNQTDVFDIGTQDKRWENIYVKYINGNTLNVSTGSFEDLSITGDIVAATGSFNNLTDGRVVTVGASGLLEDSANLTFNGTELSVTGSVIATSLTSGNVNIANNTITTTDTNGNLLLSPNGSGFVKVEGTNALVIPVGTTAQQSPTEDGAIRLNSDSGQFEGYSNGNWSSLGGVRSVDGLTYVVAEASPGASDDTIHFYASNNSVAVEVAQLTATSLNLLQTTQSTSYTSGALVVDGGAGIAGNLYVGGDLFIQGTSTTINSVSFENGFTLSGSTTYGQEYLVVNNGNNITTFSVESSSGDTYIKGALSVDGQLSGTSISVSGAITVGTDITATGDITGNNALFYGTLDAGDTNVLALSATTAEFSSNVSIGGNINVNDNFLVDSATGNTQTSGSLNVIGLTTLTGLTATTGSFTNGLSTTGDFDVNNNFTVDATTGNTVINGTLTTNGSLFSSTLIETGIAVASVNGEIVNSTNLTFDGTTLYANSNGQFTGILSSAYVEAGNLTANRVTYAGANGRLVDSSNLTFNGTQLTVNGNETVTGTLEVTGLSTLAQAQVSDLTSGRITYAGANGRLVDSSNLTFNGTTLTVTGDVVATNITGNIYTNAIESTNSQPILINSDSEFNNNVSITNNLEVGGNISIVGNLTVVGEQTIINTTNLEVVDSLIYLATGNDFNLLDIGIVGHFDNGTYQHTGFVRDASDGKWKLFSNAISEPDNNVIDFTSVVYDTLVIGSLETSTINAASVDISGTLSVDGNTNIADLYAQSAQFSGNLEVGSGFIVEASTGNTSVSGTLGVTGLSTLASAEVSDLTSGRITYAGANGRLVDSSNLTFNGTELSVTGSIVLDGDESVNGSFDVTGLSTLAQAQVSDLTSGRITYAGANGRLVDSANLTFNGTALTVTGSETITGTLEVTGLSTLAQAQVSDLTSGRITYAGANGRLVDSSNLTFNGTQLTVNGEVNITGSASVDNLKFNGNSISATDVNGSITLLPDGNGVVNLVASTAVKIPLGTTIERPLVPEAGMIRYNTTDQRYEAFDGSNWTGLGGVVDVDQNTFIRAETTPGANNNDLEFFTDGVKRINLDENGMVFTDTSIPLQVGDLILEGNTISKVSLTTGTIVLNPKTGSPSAQGTVDVYGNFTVSETATLAQAQVSDLTSGRITYAGANGRLVDSSNLTFNGTTLTVTGDIHGSYLYADSEAYLETAYVNNLTPDQIVFASTSGQLVGSSSLTFTGSTLSVTGNQYISGNLSVDGDILLGGNIRIGDNVADTIEVVADFTSNLVPATANNYSLGLPGAEWSYLYANNVEVVSTINAQSLSTVEVGSTNATITNLTSTDIGTSNLIASNSVTTSVLTATGDTSLSADLTVAGSSHLNNIYGTNLELTGSATIDQTLTVSGHTYVENISGINANFSGDGTFAGNLSIGPGVSSTFFVNGLTGDVQTVGSLSVAGHVTLEGVTSTGATGTGNIVFSNNPVFGGGAEFNSILVETVDINSNLQSTSTTTGALTVAGGVGIEKNLYVGGEVNFTLGNLYLGQTSGSGFIQLYDANRGIYFREGGIETTNFYEYGGIASTGQGYKFFTGGLKNDQQIRVHIADDVTNIWNNFNVNGILTVDSLGTNVVGLFGVTGHVTLEGVTSTGATGTGNIVFSDLPVFNGDVVINSGSLTGNVVGNVTGDLTGNVTGDLTGNVTGNLTGNVTGNVVGNVTGQISDLSNHTTNDLAEGSSNRYFTEERVHNSIQVIDNGGDGSLVYDQLTGTITYTGPSSSEVRAHFSAGTGVTLLDGNISIGQDVSPTATVEFGQVTATTINASNGAITNLDASHITTNTLASSTWINANSASFNSATVNTSITVNNSTLTGTGGYGAHDYTDYSSDWDPTTNGPFVNGVTDGAGSGYTSYGCVISNNNTMTIDPTYWANTTVRDILLNTAVGSRLKVNMPLLAGGTGDSIVTFNTQFTWNGSTYTADISTSVPVQDFYPYTLQFDVGSTSSGISLQYTGWPYTSSYNLIIKPSYWTDVTELNAFLNYCGSGTSIGTSLTLGRGTNGGTPVSTTVAITGGMTVTTNGSGQIQYYSVPVNGSRTGRTGGYTSVSYLIGNPELSLNTDLRVYGNIYGALYGNIFSDTVTATSVETETLTINGSCVLTASSALMVNTSVEVAGDITANNATISGDVSSNTLHATTAYVDNLYNSHLTAGRVTFAGQNGVLTDSSLLTFDGMILSLGGDATIAGTLSASGIATLAQLKVSDLTSGRITYAGPNGRLIDSANLTFNGSTFTVTGDQHVTGTITVDGDILLGGNIRIGDTVADTIQVVADFTSNLIPATTNTYDLGSSTLRWRTFFGNSLNVSGASTLSGNVTVGGTLSVNSGLTTLAQAQVSDLTSGRITYAGANGRLVDSANLTFNGSTLTVTGSETVAGTLEVTGLSTLAQAQVSDLTSGRITYAGANGRLVDSSNLTFNGSTLTVTGNETITGTLSVGTNLVVPVGTNAQRPSPATSGSIRYNTTSSQFEGYSNGNWASLGGVKSVDGLTYIIAESAPGASDDTLYFYTNGTLATTISETEVNFGSLVVATDNLQITGTTVSTVNAGDNITLETSGTGIVYVAGTGAMRIPAGNTLERPATGDFGFIRYNSQTNNIEAWNGVTYTGISGGSSSDANGDTLITYETAGNNEDTIRFFAGVAGSTPGSTLGSIEIMSLNVNGVNITNSLTSPNIYSSTELSIPVGTTAERPATPATGSVRFNTSTQIWEGFAQNMWQPLGTGLGSEPTYQGFTANGTDYEFTLNETPLSSAAIIVAVNGVTQEPEYAYTVEGNVLRFVDTLGNIYAPDAGDRIDVRFVSKPSISTIREYSYVGDGTTTTFDTAFDIGTKAEVMVFVNNVYQDTEVYEISENHIIFDEAPAVDDRINVLHIASIIHSNVATTNYVDEQILNVSNTATDDAIAFSIALG